MNLSMQIRRAFITLILAATAIAFVAAKTSMGAAIHMPMALSDSIPAETVSVARQTLTFPSIIAPRVVVPLIATKEHAVRKMMRTRCERVTNG